MGYISLETIRRLVKEELEMAGVTEAEEGSVVTIVDRSGEPPKKVLPPFVPSLK